MKKYGSKYSKSVNCYMEESIVRRELAENFCFYNPNYDKIEGAYDWAKTTLKEHAKDKRQFLYSLKDLDNFKTHDKLWNAAQIQMRVEGKMHGFLRYVLIFLSI
jgi:deoxyribodipyrimidine photo-lyase